MVKVCAWCQKFLGTTDSEDPLSISHGICPTCVVRQQQVEMPTVVITRKGADTLPLMEALLQGTPDIPVVLERRVADRRRTHPPSREPEDRRRLRDRRQSDGILLI
jgi:IS5 family transposase